MKLNYTIKVEGLDKLQETIDLVKQKAVELDEAIQQLNEAEITFSTSSQ